LLIFFYCFDCFETIKISGLRINYFYTFAKRFLQGQAIFSELVFISRVLCSGQNGPVWQKFEGYWRLEQEIFSMNRTP